MDLDRGGYHVEQTPFPAAFLHVDGQLLPVHATAWNRVDLCNPATGIMITPRRFEAARGQRPERAEDICPVLASSRRAETKSREPDANTSSAMAQRARRQSWAGLRLLARM
jgi:hypothetical protein